MTGPGIPRLPARTRARNHILREKRAVQVFLARMWFLASVAAGVAAGAVAAG